MSRIIFVLGAGASVHCGTPTMSNFLEVAENLWRKGKVNDVAEHFERIFYAIGYLQGIQSKAKIDTYNVETVYAAFEMGKLLGKLPGIQERSAREHREASLIKEDLIYSLRKVIGYTLEQTTHLDKGEVSAPSQYYSFTNIINSIIDSGETCSIITFNYDIGLDIALHKRGIFCDYGLNDLDISNKKHVNLLKLHGSLNWGKCECGKINPSRQFQYTTQEPNENFSIVPVISLLQGMHCKECSKIIEEDPFIVPPTWNKTAFQTQINQVWEKAAKELEDTEHIFVVGYSLPNTDLFFNYLFALGVDMRTILKGFYVYNPDQRVKERFENLLGSGIQQRFQFYNIEFEKAIERTYPIVDSNFKPIVKTIPQILKDIGINMETGNNITPVQRYYNGKKV